MPSDRRVEFLALGGPLQARVDGTVAELGGHKQRSVLAILLLNRGSVVSRARLVDELWAGRPPSSADKSIQVYVSNLRKVLGDGVIVTRGGGYELHAERGAVDADRFEQLVAEGHRLLDGQLYGEARDRLRDALALWRGPPLADLADEQFAEPEVARLEELRLRALEDRIDAELALGGHALLVPELERLVREHPLRERLRGALMLALYRCDRQADALAAYRHAHRALRDELGLEPSPALKELERAILAHRPDPGRAPEPHLRTPTPAAASRGARRGPRAALAVLGAALLVAAGAAAWFDFARAGATASAFVSPNSVAVIDAETNELAAEIRLGKLPGAIAAGAGAVWVANLEDQSVLRIDPATRSVVAEFQLGGAPEALATGHDSVWVGSASRNELIRIDPRSGRTTRIALPPRDGSEPCTSDNFPLLHSRFPRPLFVADLLVLADAVWVVCATHALARVDPARGAADAVSYHGRLPVALAHGLGSLWVANLDEDTVAAVDDFTGSTLATITAPGQPSGIATGGRSLWVTACAQDAVWRIDLDDRGRAPTSLERIAVGAAPQDIAAGVDAVWVANTGDGTISRIDLATGKVAATIAVGHRPDRIVVDDGHVWVTVQASQSSGSACVYP